MSVARYWSPNACLPMQIGFFQPDSIRGMFLHKMGSRKTVPFRIFLIVPFGLRHIDFSLNSLTLVSSGVIVAHLTATLYFNVASALSTVTLSSVASRLRIPRSKYFTSSSR
uniref:Similar to NADP-specific isocitrate dehydrogenase n=1 Tax=Arundo donax TaxID=35708 RepID=A0A0A9AEM4_ARUDO